MEKKKFNKRALTISVIALIVCASMLLGATYAWFTDTTTTGISIIQSGILDVDIVDVSSNSLEGETLNFVKAEGAEDEEILWEPGATYMLEPFMIANKGNLALKYMLMINGFNGDQKLLEAIEWKVIEGGFTGNPFDDTFEPGEGTVELDLDTYESHLLPGEENAPTLSAHITIVGHMREEAGNEYQGLTAEGISIAVLATQYTHENDSFDDQYDANAPLPWIWDGSIDTSWYNDTDTSFIIYDAADLAGLAQLVNEGNDFANKTIILDNNIDLGGRNWTPIGNFDASFQGTFDGQDHTITNFVVNNTEGSGLFGVVFRGTINNLKVTNATIFSNNYAGGIVGHGYVTMENCHVEDIYVYCIPVLVGENLYDDGAKGGGVIGYLGEGYSIYGCSAKNVNIRGYRDLGGIAGMANYDCSVTYCDVDGTGIGWIRLPDGTNYVDGIGNQNWGTWVGRRGSNVDYTTGNTGHILAVDPGPTLEEVLALLPSQP